MAFDASKDKIIKHIGEATTKDDEDASIDIKAYGEGEQKISMIRTGTNKAGKTYFAPMGRMTYEEAIGIVPLINKALKWMEDNK